MGHCLSYRRSHLARPGVAARPKSCDRTPQRYCLPSFTTLHNSLASRAYGAGGPERLRDLECTRAGSDGCGLRAPDRTIPGCAIAGGDRAQDRGCAAMSDRSADGPPVDRTWRVCASAAVIGITVPGIRIMLLL